MAKQLIIYHNNCADGFTAAWVAKKFLPEAELFPANYGDPAPDVTGMNVLIADFSYPREVLLKMADQAVGLLILDHHKSAAQDLEGIQHRKLQVVFDMDRSGAGITWDVLSAAHHLPDIFKDLFAPSVRPLLVDYVQDRDLWRFRLSQSREASAYIFSYPYTLTAWDDLFLIFEDAIHRPIAFQAGAAIERKHFKDINELITANQRTAWIGGYQVPLLNCPYFWSSDAGHIMAKGRAFAACYSDGKKERLFSLRSNDDGVDVSAIAKRYGGGGHARAAGFRMPMDWDGEDQP